MKRYTMASFVAVQVVILLAQLMILRASIVEDRGQTENAGSVEQATFIAKTSAEPSPSEPSLPEMRQLVAQGIASQQRLAGVPSNLVVSTLMVVDGDGLPLMEFSGRSGTAHFEMYNRSGDVVAALQYDENDSVWAHFGADERDKFSMASTKDFFTARFRSWPPTSHLSYVLTPKGMAVTGKAPKFGDPDLAIRSAWSLGGSAGQEPGESSYEEEPAG